MRAILLVMIGLSTLLGADFSRDETTGIVTDHATNLMWQDNNNSQQKNWQGAIDYCEGLELGSYTDWSLPNINELESIVDNSKYNPAINPVFQNTASSRYWSSTTYAINTNGAWGVGFASGGVDTGGKDDSHYVRCVRPGE